MWQNDIIFTPIATNALKIELHGSGIAKKFAILAFTIL